MTDRYLTTEEAAEVLRTTPATLRYWRHQGKGPKGFRSGRRVLYAESAVQAYVDAALASDQPGPSDAA